MIAIVSEIFGFLGPFVPKLFDIFQSKQDHAQEIELMKLRMESANSEHTWRLEKINAKADIAEAVAVHKLDSNDLPIGGFYAVAHSSSAVLALTSDKVEMQDTTYGTLATAKSRVIKNTGELTINAKDFNVEVMKLALFEDAIKDVAAAEKTWTGKAYLGRSIVVPGMIASVTSVTVRGEILAESSYRVSGGSIEFDQAAGFIDGAEVTVLHATKASTRLEGLINSNVNVQIIFEGMNLGEEIRQSK